MNKVHVTIFAILVAATAVLGTAAVIRTTGLGRAARHTNDAAVSARTRQLEAYAAKLRRELKAKPPALPRIPKPVAAAPAPQPQAPRVVYHRPPPVVVTVHRRNGDDGSRETGDSRGGGGDD